MARFYDIDEANAQLERLRPVLERLRADRDGVAEVQAELVRLRGTDGSRQHAQELREREQRIRVLVRRMQEAVAQIEAWDVTLRDIGTGLIDFPALANGRPIWLCWRLSEDRIGWWHEHDTGFDARKPLLELT
ncbi:MAG: DUF2203 domain-containing protein [Chloroflexota bacterium]|nr:DUF2203 domain-containing protein [Chloroflexota bacterium]